MRSLSAKIGSCSKRIKFPYTLQTVNFRLPHKVKDVRDYFDSCNEVFIKKYTEEHNLKPLAKHIEEDKKEIKKKLDQFIKKINTNDEIDKFNDNLTDAYYWNQHLDEYKNETKKNARFKEINAIATESYVYRFLHSIFSNSNRSGLFSLFDPFYQQKYNSLKSSNKAANSLFDYVLNIGNQTNETEFELFAFILQVCLWGNRADLIIPAGLSASDEFIRLADLNKRKSNILTNVDKVSDEIYKLFKHDFKNKDNLRIDLICDNVGLELISDLALIEFLYQSKLIDPNKTKIRFFIKKYSWFISDVCMSDFKFTLDYLNTYVFEDNDKKEMVKRWNNRLENGEWKIEVNQFFTTPYEYFKMERVCKDLYDDFCKSDLLIFKGDLNYVKLLGNLYWNPQTPFSISIQNFKPTNIVSLRAAKYNLVVDLDDDKILDKLDPKWYVNGDYGMISFYKKE